ncbi:SPOR domain-containing protein [Pleomorphovibrio marinus]|uniref:SPOR domain-containing protein n=1 Tax=Pleomorphovibrio marinus TaxID=2164132 RepID=UPI000E0B361D|nr:SPOR domain-containing protein [Pleomorphovibrio marinus]
MADKKDPNDKDQHKEDEDFGMPEVDITPIGESTSEPKKKPHAAAAPSSEKKVATKKAKVAAVPKKDKPKEEKKSRSGFFFILLLLLLFGAGYAFYYYGVFDQMGDSQPTTTTTAPEEEDPVVEEAVPPAPEELAEEPEAPAEETFILTEITSKTNVPRYFVVVGSFIDEDLAKDYSNRLNNRNKSTFLIHPYDDISFYRLAVGQHESFNQALTQMNDIQGDFEENLWVLKY